MAETKKKSTRSTKANSKTTKKTSSAKTTAKKTSTKAVAASKTSASKAKSVNFNFDWKKVKPVKSLMNSHEVVYGLYSVLLTGALFLAKYYLQYSVTNNLFHADNQQYALYWIGAIDGLFFLGLVALVALPAYFYFKQQGIKKLILAMIVAFLVGVVALAGFWWFLSSVPAPATPNFPYQYQ